MILNRHRTSSFVITSNRGVDEWLGLFDDPILGNSAFDRRPTPAIRQPSRAKATGNACRLIAHCWAQAGKEVIDRNTKPDNTQITMPQGGSMTLEIDRRNCPQECKVDSCPRLIGIPWAR